MAIRCAPITPRPTHIDRKSTRLELQSLRHLVCRLLLEKKKNTTADLHHSATNVDIVTAAWLTRCHKSPCRRFGFWSYVLFVDSHGCRFFFFFFNEWGAPGDLHSSPTRGPPD